MHSLRELAATILLVGAVAAAACGPADPREAILAERARWEVALLSWAGGDAGQDFLINVRVSGPVRSSLDRLTVFVEFRDATEAVVAGEWATLDLGEIERGGPKDMQIRLAPRPEVPAIVGIAIDSVANPTPEQMSHLIELGS